MFKKIKNLVNSLPKNLRSFIFGSSMSGCLAIGHIAASVALISSISWFSLPLAGVSLGLCFLTYACSKEPVSFVPAAIGFVLGSVVPSTTYKILVSDQSDNANIFKSDRQAVTQTFNHTVPKIEDGFTYKGVTYKVPAQDIMKKAA